MAILKHMSSKSADYGRAMEYLMYQHDRYSNSMLFDERGNCLMRENFLIDAIDCSVSTFDAECMALNRKYGKNHDRNDVKSHHYIISFDPKDALEGALNVEDAQRIGMEYAKRNFPGHQALVATHDDGDNGSHNIHVHIIINSLRKRDVDRQSFMERTCDAKAGYKHHLTDKYLSYLKRDLMKTCEQEKLHQVDLLSPAKRRVTEKEYWAGQRGLRRLDRQLTDASSRCNRPDLHIDPDAPDFTVKSRFETQKEQLRLAIEDVSKEAISEADFGRRLKEKYNIIFKISRGRYSYIHPDREKAITGRALGTDYTEATLRQIFSKNAAKLSAQKDNTLDEEKNDKPDIRPGIAYPHAFTMDTKIGYVRDLQTIAISDVNRAYERKVKLSNIQAMADTIMYIDEHGLKSRYEVADVREAMRTSTSDARSALKASEDTIKGLNEQIHYTGQYLTRKKLYADYLKSKRKDRFRNEHEADLIIYEAARKWLKTHAEEGTMPSYALLPHKPGMIPNLKQVKAKRNELIEKQKELRSVYKSAQMKLKEIDTVGHNLDTILKQPDITKMKSRSRNSVIE